ncbi:MAG: PrsW family intramembrane metalloprotease [Myxococcota bacterium]
MTDSPKPPPLPPPLPPSRTVMLSRATPPDPVGRAALGVSCGVLFVGVLMFSLLCAFANIAVPLAMAPGWAIASAVSAVGLGLPHVLVILWLDRNEQEPWYLLATAWGWGAVIATGLSIVANTIFGLVAMGIIGDTSLAMAVTASVSAPLFEEITKGAALLAIYLFFRRDFDNVLDGLIYGALVGMGFAMMENFIYYTGPVISGSETLATDWATLVFLRGVVTSVGTHACFTAMTGMGFGLFRVLRRGALRWLLPPLGLGFAMFAHFSWNTFTGFFVYAPEDTVQTLLVSVPVAVIVLQSPFLLLVFGVAGLTLWHEGVLIKRYLTEERRSVVALDEIQILVPARRRFFYAVALLMSGKASAWLHRRRRNRLLVQLAFERWHMDKEESVGTATEAGIHARRVIDLRRALRELGPSPASA